MGYMITTTAIIPVYNVKKYLKRCLDSVLNQTVLFQKIVVVNDGSTDGCEEICNVYAEQFERIQAVHKKNGGLVSAWMEGLKYVETSHICFVDSDDYVSPDFHECLLNNAKDRDIDFVSMQCIQYIDQMHQYKLNISTLPAGTYCVDDKIRSVLLCDRGAFNRPIAICRWAKIIRTDLVLKYSQYCTDQISYAEDQQLTLGILTGCKKIRLIDEYKYYYQFNPDSILNSYRSNMWQKIVLLMRTIRKIPGIEEFPDFEFQYNTQYLLHMAECFRNEFNHHQFHKKFYDEVLDHDEIRKALKAYGTEKMRRIDKIICHYAERKKYYSTWVVLELFKSYYQLRKKLGRQL